MSKWSGKCDFRDDLEIFYHDNWEDFKNNAKVYLNKELLIFNSPADLIPYYPYISGSSCGQRNDDGGYSWSCWLSSNYLEDKISDFTKLSDEGIISKDSVNYLLYLKEELNKLYNIEKEKPINEQRII